MDEASSICEDTGMGGTIEHTVLTRDDPAYPESLLELQRPPAVLYVKGNSNVFSEPMISIIGARRATPYGICVAEMAGRISAECGLCVVSGGAMGCDAAALRAAQKAGGKTLIVSGCGADLIYPQSSADVFAGALKRGGAVVSLFPWDRGATRWSFRERNALIAACSRVLMVCEAGNKSGTMSTADTACELDRIIYAIPGSIFSPTSAGCNHLIADGARIIADEQALEMSIAMDYGVMRFCTEGLSREMTPVLSALIASPMRVDDLAEHLNCGVLEVLKTLTDYEAKGFVVRLGDARYSPTKTFLMEHNIAMAGTAPTGGSAAACGTAGASEN